MTRGPQHARPTAASGGPHAAPLAAVPRITDDRLAAAKGIALGGVLGAMIWLALFAIWWLA
jgi:hypothetical protein